MNDQQRFLAFYGNTKHQSSLGCNGTAKLGDSYVCPEPTIGGQIRDQPVQATACGTPVSTTSRLASAQVGGSEQRHRCGHRIPAPIGNRPVFGTHDNDSVNTPTEWKGHLLDHKFDCQQPLWCEKCI
jgi:hypothetical protein